MNPQQAKALAKANAATRSKTRVRTTSSSSTQNSQLTSSPPTVYRLEKLNVPADMTEMIKVLHSELQKIEQSQSVVLSIWERVKDQYANQDGVTFDKTVNFAGGLEIDGHDVDWSALWERTDFTAQDDAFTYTGTTWGNTYFGYTDQSTSGYRVSWATNQQTQIAHEAGTIEAHAAGAISLNAGTQITCNSTVHGQAAQAFQQWGGTYNLNGGGSAIAAFPLYLNEDTRDNLYQVRGATSAYHYSQWNMAWDGTGATTFEIRSDGHAYMNGGLLAKTSTMESYIGMTVALTRQELKAEIYTELLALNSGLVVPVVENPQQE
ncbi:hypothetical protein FDX19_15540 [Citrobacter sp. wls619]|uniref:hypothetical protein n=1 Tax=Citrobacter sp. wls619 TaxID=2576432 RepID=UPI0010C9E839|nr:hypothetical protein [Citrobacter sp. wls619]TKV08249.1 hypothetical protein FDX19_15540 [Citrobacter sp. wls619]